MHGDGVGVEGPVGVNVNMRGDGQPFPIFIVDGDEGPPPAAFEQVFVAAEAGKHRPGIGKALAVFIQVAAEKPVFGFAKLHGYRARIGGQRFLDPFAVAGDGVFQIGKPLDFPLNCLQAVLQDLLPLGKMILVDVFVNLF